MKIGIVGSREYPDKKNVTSFIENVLLSFSNDIKLVSGGSGEGVDKWVQEYALENNIGYREFLPEFKEDPEKDYDVRDYHRRNREIAEYCDVVFAFHHENSKGTQSAIEKCRKEGTPVFVYKPEEIEYATS